MIIQLKSGAGSKLLRPKKYYVVLAVYIGDKNDFMVLGEDFSFPIAISSDDVDVIDNRLSRYWVLGSVTSQKWAAILAFPEWANNQYFYQNLVESKGDANDIFRQYERKLKNEYADIGMTVSATLLQDDWYQCPLCEDTWQCNELGEVIICQGCNEKLLRP